MGILLDTVSKGEKLNFLQIKLSHACRGKNDSEFLDEPCQFRSRRRVKNKAEKQVFN